MKHLLLAALIVITLVVPRGDANASTLTSGGVSCIGLQFALCAGQPTAVTVSYSVADTPGITQAADLAGVLPIGPSPEGVSTSNVDYGRIRTRLTAEAAIHSPLVGPTSIVQIAAFATGSWTDTLRVFGTPGQQVTLDVTGHFSGQSDALASALTSVSLIDINFQFVAGGTSFAVDEVAVATAANAFGQYRVPFTVSVTVESGSSIDLYSQLQAVLRAPLCEAPIAGSGCTTQAYFDSFETASIDSIRGPSGTTLLSAFGRLETLPDGSFAYAATPVPEASTLSLFGIGAIAVMFAALLRRRRDGCRSLLHAAA